MEARKRCIVKRCADSGGTVFCVPISESSPHFSVVHESENQERTSIVVFVIWVTVLLLKEAVAGNRDRLSCNTDPNSMEGCYVGNSCSDYSPYRSVAQLGRTGKHTRHTNLPYPPARQFMPTRPTLPTLPRNRIETISLCQHYRMIALYAIRHQLMLLSRSISRVE